MIKTENFTGKNLYIMDCLEGNSCNLSYICSFENHLGDCIWQIFPFSGISNIQNDTFTTSCCPKDLFRTLTILSFECPIQLLPPPSSLPKTLPSSPSSTPSCGTGGLPPSAQPKASSPRPKARPCPSSSRARTCSSARPPARARPSPPSFPLSTSSSCLQKKASWKTASIASTSLPSNLWPTIFTKTWSGPCRRCRPWQKSVG